MPRNHRSKSPRRASSPSGSIAAYFFLAGCAAECYILTVYRYYYRGTMRQMLAWADLLPVLGGIGLAAAASGLILFFRTKQLPRILGGFLGAEGIFMALSSFLIRWNMSAVLMFMILVPLATMLGALWLLYDRECALSLTMLGTAAFVSWICHHGGGYIMLSKIIALGYAVVLAVLAYLLRRGKLQKFLPPASMAVDASCALSIAGLLVSAFTPAAAYYALWGLGLVIFALVVYYTVKQL